MFEWGTLLSLATASDQIIDNKKRLALLKRMKLLISKNKKIVIFGVSGVGKSQFINNLKNNLKIAIRTETIERIRFDLDDIPILFVDTPGQSIKQQIRQNEVVDIYKNGVEGIINVVSYGYEENPDYKLNDIFINGNKVKKSFLKTNRKAEIDRMDEWMKLLQPENIKWIINLVNKADLWFDEFEIVKKHYDQEFRKVYQHLEIFKEIHTLPYCSIIKPYYDTFTSGKFGEIHKQKLHNNFINLLYNVMK